MLKMLKMTREHRIRSNTGHSDSGTLPWYSEGVPSLWLIRHNTNTYTLTFHTSQLGRVFLECFWGILWKTLYSSKPPWAEMKRWEGFLYVVISVPSVCLESFKPNWTVAKQHARRTFWQIQWLSCLWVAERECSGRTTNHGELCCT